MLVVVGMLAVAAGGSQAAPVITLNDMNSVATIDVGSQAGQFHWYVDGGNQLAKQWFWYRVGNSPEASIDTLGAPTITQASARNLSVQYASPQFTVQIDFLLTGGQPGSGASDIAETISIHNTSGAVLPFHFYQYADFDLNGIPGGDSVQFLGPYVVQQTKGPTTLSETVATPGSSHREAALFNQTLLSLNDAAPTILSDSNAAGPGNVAWAFQWDRDIAAGGTLLISKDKRLEGVPEPTTLALLALGGLLAHRRQVA